MAAVQSWESHLRVQLLEQRQRESAPFHVVDVYKALQDRYAAQSDELRSIKRDRDRWAEGARALEDEAVGLRLAAQGLVLHSAKEKELEEKLAAMSQQLSAALEQTNRLLSVEHHLRETKASLDEMTLAKARADDTIFHLERQLAEQTNTNTVLKRENEALQTENAMQRAQFAKEKAENERLIPTVLNAKRIEAELRNELTELQQRMLELSTGNPSVARGSFSMPREVLFAENDSTVGLRTTCVSPSYVAFCNDDAHPGEIHTVTVTENGRQLWTGGGDKIVKGWDANNGSPVGRFATPASTVCLDSKSTYLVAGCVDFTCLVWHLPTMRTQCQLTGHTEAVTSAYLSHDAHRVFTASRDCTIKSWDLQRGALLHTSLCASSCYDLAVAMDRICTAHFDNSIRLWDIRSGKSCGELRNLHEKAVTSVRIAADNTTCVTLSRDNSIKVVDLRKMQETAKFTDPRFSIQSNLARLTLSPDGAFCAAGCSSGEVVVFNLRDGHPAKFLSKGHTAPVVGVCWSPDGRGLASVGVDKRVIFWR